MCGPTGESMMKHQNPLPKTGSPVTPGRFLLVFIGLCLAALPIVVYSALSQPPEDQEEQVRQVRDQRVDHHAESLFDAFDQTSTAYMDGSSSARTLAEFYSRRQYPGSPPIIPHKISVADEKGCLTCHAKGGWAAEHQRYTPVTPHPEKTACRQCHVKPKTKNLFVEHHWQTIKPPLLGRSYLPGGPPPVPHTLQMRENCIACHVGPGAVTPIRVEHPMRGNCRQCHVPALVHSLFTRSPAESEHSNPKMDTAHVE